MNSERLLQHFEQIAEAPDIMRHIWRFYPDYYDREVPIPQMPSGILATRKSQMESGFLQNTLPKRSRRIAQMPSAKLAAVLSLKKPLIEWVMGAESQSELGDKYDEP